MSQENEIFFIEWLKDFFSKKKKPVNVGDIGIYRDVLNINTVNNDTHTLYYDIFTKVRALAVYDELIEIEILDVSFINACNQDVKNIIDSNMPKYIRPKFVSWEVKQ